MAFELPPDHVPLDWNEPVALQQRYWDQNTGFVEYVRSTGAVVLAAIPAQEQPWVNGEYPTRFGLGEGAEQVVLEYESPRHAQYRLGSFALLDEPLLFIPSGPMTFALDVLFARRRDEVARQHKELRQTGDPEDREAAKRLYEDLLAEKAAYMKSRAQLEAQYS